MKKKPIYLWVLLIFSALLSAMSLFGIISPVPTAEGMNNLETSASGVNATYAKELVAYTIKVSEHGHSIFNILLVVLSVILVVVSLVFLVRKNIQLANYTYLAYVFVAIIGSIYNFIGVQDAVSLFTDPNIRMGAELGAKGSAILVVVALVFLVRKNIQLANYTYIGYVFLAILGSIYNFVGVQDALSLFTDPNVRMGAELGAKGYAIFGIVLNVIFLAIVFYKMWRQQKELTETQEEEELA